MLRSASHSPLVPSPSLLIGGGLTSVRNGLSTRTSSPTRTVGVPRRLDGRPPKPTTPPEPSSLPGDRHRGPSTTDYRLGRCRSSRQQPGLVNPIPGSHPQRPCDPN